MDRISKHITYAEAINSYTAKKEGIDNTPGEEELKAMKLLSIKVIEPLRESVGVALYFPSFYRSIELNNKIGGAYGSQHTKGEAIDIDADRFGGTTNKIIFDYIFNNLEFDQLIWEFGNDHNPDWVHVSYKKNNNRKQVLKAVKENGKTKYINYEKQCS